MSDLNQAEFPEISSLARMASHKPFWDVLSPTAENEKLEPSLEARAGWLRTALILWSHEADAFVHDFERRYQEAKQENNALGSYWLEQLGLRFDSLSHAANSLLAFKTHGRLVEIPETFTQAYHHLLTVAEEQGVHSDEFPISKVALRLAAASFQISGPRHITTDEQGRVFDSNGTRMFQFEPKKMLKAKQDVREGKLHSLPALNEADE